MKTPPLDKRHIKSTGNYPDRATLTAAIERLHAQGEDNVAISATVGVSRTTVGRLLKKDTAPALSPIHQDGAGKQLNDLLNSLWRIQPSTSVVPSGHFAADSITC